MIDVALATPADVPRMVAISNQAALRGSANFATEPEPLAAWQAAFESSGARYPWLVARVADEGVGFAKASPHRARGAYAHSVEVSVYLDPAWQGRGLGTRLYASLLPLLRAQGYACVLAGITCGHQASERLHARLGFARVGTFHRVGWKQGAWHDVGYWELHLQRAGEPPRRLLPVGEAPLVRREPLEGARARALIAALDAELAAAYPEPGANHFRLDPTEVGEGQGAFLIATLEGEAVGCGAVRRLDETRAELKRMYVRPAWRARRIGAALLGALELEARLLRVRRLVLETGDRQAEALALYQRAGFVAIEPFGEYLGSPLSRCFEKELAG